MASEYSDTTAFLQGVVRDAMTEASNNASRIYSLPPGVNTRDPHFRVDLERPNIGPPPNFGDLFGGDSTDSTIQFLNAQADAWVAKYFPEMNACFRNMPEEQLCGILSGVKPFGIDKTIFELVWHQARDRAYRTVESERQTLMATYSSRGFTLPPGALVDQLAQVERRASDTILDVNREQAIKDADIKQRMLELAMQLATQLKTAILSSLADFYRAWITVPDKDTERARIRAQATAALYNALASYYNVEISFQELNLRAAQTQAEVDVNVDRNRLSRQGNFAPVAAALGSAVSAFANVASQASQAGGTLSAQIEAV